MILGFMRNVYIAESWSRPGGISSRRYPDNALGLGLGATAPVVDSQCISLNGRCKYIDNIIYIHIYVYIMRGSAVAVQVLRLISFEVLYFEVLPWKLADIQAFPFGIPV